MLRSENEPHNICDNNESNQVSIDYGHFGINTVTEDKLHGIKYLAVRRSAFSVNEVRNGLPLRSSEIILPHETHSV